MASDGSRALEIRHRRESDTFHLAVWKNEGPLHESTRPLHKPDPEASGRAGYMVGVLREGLDGEAVVSLDVALRRTTPQAPLEAPLPAEGRPGRGRQRAMTLLGLLHLLWERAGLATWCPAFSGYRTPGVRLGRVSGCCRALRTRQQSLADLLCPVAQRHPGVACRLQVVADHLGPSRRLFLLGIVDRLEPPSARRDAMQVLQGQRGASYDLFTSVPKAEYARLLHSAPWAATLLGQEPAERAVPVVALLCVTADRIKDGEWAGLVAEKVIRGTFMVVSPAMIPVDSRHELTIGEALVEAERSFEKPLRFDADQDLVFPDFVLTDTAARDGYPMEVFGRTDEDYQTRRAEKADYYNGVFGSQGWWSWNAASDPTWPPFPATLERKKTMTPPPDLEEVHAALATLIRMEPDPATIETIAAYHAVMARRRTEEEAALAVLRRYVALLSDDPIALRERYYLIANDARYTDAGSTTVSVMTAALRRAFANVPHWQN